MRLEGSLDAFSLPDIFSLLSMTKKTGGLHLRRTDSHGVVWLADGLITGGASDVSRLALGRRIAGSTFAGDDQLRAAVESVTNHPEIGVARALRDAHAIDESDLQALVSEHVVDTVFDLMRWPDGSFEFVLDEQNVDDVGVTRTVDDVVVEARLRLDAWASFDERVVTADTILALTLDPGGDPTLVREEWALMALVDGRRTVGDLVNLYGRGEYAVVVALAELVRRGLIRPADNEGTAGLVRRRDLVASLETAQPDSADASASTEIEQPADPTPASEPAEPALSVAEPGPVEESVASEDEPDSGSSLITDLDVDIQMESAGASDHSEGGPVSALARSVSADEGDEFGQTRSEPFMAARQPDQGEVLATAGGSTLTAAAPATAGTIERDPSVNKSLLLRLIAGVRGL